MKSSTAARLPSTHTSCAGGSRRLTQRLFAGCPRTRTRKKSHGPYETLDRCALIRSAMAKVERRDCMKSSWRSPDGGSSVAPNTKIEPSEAVFRAWWSTASTPIRSFHTVSEGEFSEVHLQDPA